MEGAGALNTSGAGIWILGAVALGLIIWGIIEITESDEHDLIGDAIGGTAGAPLDLKVL